MENIKSYDQFTNRKPEAERLASVSKVHPDEVNEDPKTEAEKLKDEKEDEIERQSQSIDASGITVDSNESIRFISRFTDFKIAGN